MILGDDLGMKRVVQKVLFVIQAILLLACLVCAFKGVSSVTLNYFTIASVILCLAINLLDDRETLEEKEEKKKIKEDKKSKKKELKGKNKESKEEKKIKEDSK